MQKNFFKSIKIFLSPDKPLYQSLHNILGFYPTNIELYKLALRHSSAAQPIKKGIKNSNERLEFLGDSIISTIIAEYLFKKFPYKDEGFLTKTRSKMVSRAQHNKIALKLGLDELLEVNTDFIGSKTSSINGDSYEALIGAIYLDKGYCAAQNYLLNRIIDVHIDMHEVENKEVDFKSKFIEWAQKEKKEFNYELINNENADDKQYTIRLMVENKVLGFAQHISKKRAEQMVSEQACNELRI
ncbi:MAG: ribonuclease III [Bacteroidia bacterium]